MRFFLRLLFVLASVGGLVSCSPPRADRPVIGAKNFTEQVILGELLAQHIEAKTGLPVERRFYLAGSYIAHQALTSGRIDAYVEYTGTALTAILKQPLSRDAAAVRQTVQRLYAQKYNVTVAPSLGFENTFAMVMRREDAERFHIKNLSDLTKVAPQLRLGVGYEFQERPDGLQGLSSTYALHFNGSPHVMDLGLLYRAMKSKQVDIVAGNSTDGPIQALGLTALADDRHYFPPYEAVPLVRSESFERWPQLRTALLDLKSSVSAEEMQSMNQAVDGQHRDPQEVVREFRLRKGL